VVVGGIVVVGAVVVVDAVVVVGAIVDVVVDAVVVVAGGTVVVVAPVFLGWPFPVRLAVCRVTRAPAVEIPALNTIMATTK